MRHTDGLRALYKKIPEMWKLIKVVMIPKEDSDDLRPISISVTCWRILMCAALTNLEDWIAQWVDPDLHGGIKGRSTEELHSDFDEDLQMGIDGAHIWRGKTDLFKCFEGFTGLGNPRVGRAWATRRNCTLTHRLL